ncbi:MAG TPA: NADH-quinone oxidoreductase subunit NuoH [Gammaproteobacteria bacterium]
MSAGAALGFIAALILLLLLAGAYLTWIERRVLAWWQDRYGPNRAGPFGVLQAIADVVKILLKEDWIPPLADKPVFVIAPAIVAVTMLLAFAVVPFAPGLAVAELNVGLLFFLAMTSLSVYSVAFAGWASNNNYSLLGSMRTAAQMISYEVFMGLSLVGVVILAGSFNLFEIVEAQRGLWYFVPQFVGLLVFFLASIAETHRLPFDLPEAEHELVAGYHTEYSSMKFGLFFLGEYLGILLAAAMTVTLFFGGWLGPAFLPPIVWFLLKMAVFVGLFLLLRAALPRPRYDQLMAYAWKFLLPLSLVNLLVTGAVVLLMEG